MRRATVAAVLLALLACLVRPASAVMSGVLQFSEGNSTFQGPIYQVATGSGGTVLWAVGPGVLYQINSTSMQYINSTSFPSYTYPSPGSTVLPYLPTCLFVDDTYNRVYACFSPGTGPYMTLYVVNALTLSVLGRESFAPPEVDGSIYVLSQTLHFYDAASRIFASVAFVPNTVYNEVGINLFNVSGDAFAAVNSFAAQNVLYTSLSGMQYVSGADAINIWWYELQSFAFYNYLQSATGVSSSSPSFVGGALNPFNAHSTPLSASGQFVSGPMTFTSSYTYATFVSYATPSQGSYVLQFTNPIAVSGSAYNPKSAIAFPTQPSILAVSVDETAVNSTSGVLFLSTGNGQLLKYRYSDPGGSNPMAVTTPNYNADTQVSSANPTFNYQTYSKTAQAIYLSSSSLTGGIWRVPFHNCGAATTCSSCAALNDPYCGWCPLSGTCTTNASCSTGKILQIYKESKSLPLPINSGRFFECAIHCHF
jgi:hypothetical protein